MLSGRRAFAAGSTADIMTAILTKDPLAERDGEPSLPLAVERIVARGLEKTPEARCDPSGVLLVARGSQILAQALSVDSLELQGTPVAVAGPVSHDFTSGAAIFAAGRNLLAVRPEGPRRTEQLTWYDREGRPLGTVGAPDPISTFDLSPDGRSVVVARTTPTGGGGEVLLVIDTARGVTSRLTGREFDFVDDPVWSPDSRRVAFRALRGGKSVLVVKPADGGAGRVVMDGQGGDV